MISYDDKTSFGKDTYAFFVDDFKSWRCSAAKGKFINDNALAGFAVWHVAGDSNNILLSAISDSMGVVQVCSWRPLLIMYFIVGSNSHVSYVRPSLVNERCIIFGNAHRLTLNYWMYSSCTFDSTATSLWRCDCLLAFLFVSLSFHWPWYRLALRINDWKSPFHFLWTPHLRLHSHIVNMCDGLRRQYSLTLYNDAKGKRKTLEPLYAASFLLPRSWRGKNQLVFALSRRVLTNVSPDFLLLRASEQPIYLRARSLSTPALQLERISEHNILQNGKVIPISSVIPPKVAANTSSNAHDVVVVEILGEQ